MDQEAKREGDEEDKPKRRAKAKTKAKAKAKATAKAKAKAKAKSKAKVKAAPGRKRKGTGEDQDDEEEAQPKAKASRKANAKAKAKQQHGKKTQGEDVEVDKGAPQEKATFAGRYKPSTETMGLIGECLRSKFTTSLQPKVRSPSTLEARTRVMDNGWIWLVVYPIMFEKSMHKQR